MRLGYNTNGFAYHRLEDALRILADLGYQSVAITLDYQHLNPFDPEPHLRVDALRGLLEELKLRSVIETGARFLLDPRRKHQPTLVSPDPDDQFRRVLFLSLAVEIAHRLGSEAVSFWSGASLTDEPPEVLNERLVIACRSVVSHAETRRVRLAFEPEPGMFIDTMAKFAQLHHAVDSPWFGLTIDVGHLHCMGEVPICNYLRQWKDWLWNLHIEDMRRGVHEHLMFGEGEIDFGPVLRTLHEIGYQGGVHVELSRHAHDAVEAARRAAEFLRARWPSPPVCSRGAKY